nr:MAG TPA_asm: hypothetical protein [Caudoviricetes sp.]
MIKISRETWAVVLTFCGICWYLIIKGIYLLLH